MMADRHIPHTLKWKALLMKLTMMSDPNLSDKQKAIIAERLNKAIGKARCE